MKLRKPQNWKEWIAAIMAGFIGLLLLPITIGAGLAWLANSKIKHNGWKYTSLVLIAMITLFFGSAWVVAMFTDEQPAAVTQEQPRTEVVENVISGEDVAEDTTTPEPEEVEEPPAPAATPVAPPPAPVQSQPPPPAPSSCTAGQVNINTAGQEELKAIIHIDDVRSAEIIAKRPFASVDDLTRVKGIGPARLKDIKDQGLACV